MTGPQRRSWFTLLRGRCERVIWDRIDGCGLPRNFYGGERMLTAIMPPLSCVNWHSGSGFRETSEWQP